MFKTLQRIIRKIISTPLSGGKKINSLFSKVTIWYEQNKKNNIRNTRPVVKVPLRDKREPSIVSYMYPRYIAWLNYPATIMPFKQTKLFYIQIIRLVLTNFEVSKDVISPRQSIKAVSHSLTEANRLDFQDSLSLWISCSMHKHFQLIGALCLKTMNKKIR